MTEPIRVLHVFGALNPGGVETFVLNVYRAIDTTRVQFDFALTQGVKSLFDDEVLVRGGRIYYFDQHRSMQQNLAHVLKTGGPFAAVHSHVYFYSGRCCDHRAGAWRPGAHRARTQHVLWAGVYAQAPGV